MHFKNKLLKRLILLLTIIIAAFNSFGQDKNIVLQIDTLILNGYDKFSITITDSDFENFGDIVIDSIFVRNNVEYPNFICSLTLQTDSSNIQISLDDHGGYLQLLDAYKLQNDTLKINKFVVFNNCYRDTTFMRIDYYLKNPDGSIAKPYRTKYTKKVSKIRCKNRPLIKTAYRINNELYSVSFHKKESIGTEITVFHGYKPKKYLKNRENYKGKVTYFHGQLETFHYINVITLNLKDTMQIIKLSK